MCRPQRAEAQWLLEKAQAVLDNARSGNESSMRFDNAVWAGGDTM